MTNVEIVEGDARVICVSNKTKHLFEFNVKVKFSLTIDESMGLQPQVMVCVYFFLVYLSKTRPSISSTNNPVPRISHEKKRFLGFGSCVFGRKGWRGARCERRLTAGAAKGGDPDLLAYW